MSKRNYFVTYTSAFYLYDLCVYVYTLCSKKTW